MVVQGEPARPAEEPARPAEEPAGGAGDGGQDGAPPAPGPRRLHPRMVLVWTVQAAAAALVAALAVLVLEVLLRLRGVEPPWPRGLAAVAVVALAVPLVGYLPAASHRRWRFELAADALELRHGLVQHVHSAIPYFRVQYIDLKQGPVERVLGLSRLVIHTAAASTDAEIPGVASAEAETLRRTLLERAGVGDAV